MNGNIEAAFIGTVIDPPTLKQSQAGKPWAAFRVAVGNGDDAQFVRVAVFGELAERLAPAIDKGAKLYVEGTIRLDRWKTASGEDRAGLSCAAWKAEKVGASAIGRNKLPKPKPAPDHQAPPDTNAGAPLDDAIPF